jgi:predicted RND superfamily exporter protein
MGAERGNARVVLAIAGALAVASLVACPFLGFENDPLNYFPANSPVVRGFSTLNARLTGMLPFQVCVDAKDDPAGMLARTPGVRKVIDTTRFLQGQGRTYWCLADNGSLPRLTAAQGDWAAWASKNATKLEWCGVAAQLAEAARLVRRVVIGSLPFMALVAGVVVGVAHRSVRLGAASIAVNLLPVLLLALPAAVFGWPLDLPSLMIGSILVGVAVDDTLHLLAARAARGSMRRALVECWVPCAGSSLVVAACLAMFAISPFRPTAQFGLLMSAGVVLALLSDMYLLPALIRDQTAQTGKVNDDRA